MCSFLLPVVLFGVCASAADVTAVTDSSFDEVVMGNPNAWLINFNNNGKNSAKFVAQWADLTSKLKRVDLGTVDTDTEQGKKLAQWFKISMAKMPYVALFKHTVAHATPIIWREL